MKFAILCCLAALPLAACATGPSSAHYPRDTRPLPAVKNFTPEQLDAGASEIEGGQCPTLGGVFMPEFKNMRDQTRVIREAR